MPAAMSDCSGTGATPGPAALGFISPARTAQYRSWARRAANSGNQLWEKLGPDALAAAQQDRERKDFRLALLRNHCYC